MKNVLPALLCLVCVRALAQPPTPVQAVQRVADKMIRTTPFQYRLSVVKPSAVFDNIKFLNLARTFGAGKPGVAYALTVIDAPADTTLTIEISHNDGMKVFINQVVVYEKKGDRPAAITYRERAVDLANEFPVRLKKGPNTLLLKSETRGESWAFYLRPKHNFKGLQLRPDLLPNVGPDVAALSNWLVIGPFPNDIQSDKRSGLDRVYEPENGFETGQLYTHNGIDGPGQPVAWTVPKSELSANGYGSALAWGDNNFSWNYHAGGTAWAMAHLGDYTGEKRFTAYSKSYCDFFVAKRPYLAFQKYELGGMGSVDAKIWESQMLDFSAAPTLPYTYWLEQKGNFAGRAGYEKLFADIKDYTVNRQFRLPEGNFARSNPHRYTTWADDMYMGIPFLVHAAQITRDPAEKTKLMDDAVKQLFAFNAQVWDPEFNLYRQTQYSDRKVKIPFWSRANGWGLWATAEILLNLPKSHPKYPAVLAHYKTHIDALLTYQNPKTGFWHNLIDKPDSYAETSGTAIFVMALARGINQGWLDRKMYLAPTIRGWQAIAGMIDADGTLHGTCIGTNMSENIQDYYTRPVADDDTHGVLPVLFAGIEMDKVLKAKVASR